ncbi:MAG TPA: hypothetical protein VLS25_00045 [Dehalococcoidia bacterium]|nr:hypothetical protein [Dehalococcoidia bacterium]
MPLMPELGTILSRLPLAGKAALLGSAVAIVGGFAFLGGTVLLAGNQEDAPATRSGQEAPGSLPLGRIAYVRDGSLWTIDLDNGEDRPLVDRKLHATVGVSADDLSLYSPKWSPNGDWIAYGVRSTGAVPFDLTAAVPTAVEFQYPAFLGLAGRWKWAPAGDLIAVQEPGGGIRVQKPTLGGPTSSPDRRQRGLNLSLGDFAWSPDGQYLAAGPDPDSSVAASGNHGDLYLAELRAVQPTVTPTDTSTVPGVKVGYSGQGPVQVQSWSPDGKYVLFWEGVSGEGSRLLSLAMDGGATVDLGSVLAQPSSAAWSPDSGLVAVIQFDDPQAWFKKRLVIMSPSGEGKGSLPNTEFAEAEPSWAPDGSRLAFVRMPAAEPSDSTPLGAARIWTVSPDGTGAVQLTDDADYSDRFPRWSADGSRILFVRLPADAAANNGPLRPELWIMNADGSHKERAGALPLIDGLSKDGYMDWGQYFDWYRPAVAEGPSPAVSPTPTPAPWDTPIATPLPLSPSPSRLEAPVGTPVPPTPLLSRPVGQDGEVWALVAAAASANISPVLYPASPPEGFEIVTLSWLLGEAPDAHGFEVEYTGPGRRLSIGVAEFNPPPPGPGGHQEAVKIRGQECAPDIKGKECLLTVDDNANPAGHVWLHWFEHGRWVPEPGAAAVDSVEYLVSAEGLDPQEVIAIVESLVPPF